MRLEIHRARATDVYRDAGDASLFTQKTAYEVLWGWDDPLLYAVNASLS